MSAGDLIRGGGLASLESRQAMTWAQRLKRVFAIEIIIRQQGVVERGSVGVRAFFWRTAGDVARGVYLCAGTGGPAFHPTLCRYEAP